MFLCAAAERRSLHPVPCTGCVALVFPPVCGLAFCVAVVHCCLLLPFVIVAVCLFVAVCVAVGCLLLVLRFCLFSVCVAVCCLLVALLFAALLFVMRCCLFAVCTWRGCLFCLHVAWLFVLLCDVRRCSLRCAAVSFVFVVCVAQHKGTITNRTGTTHEQEQVTCSWSVDTYLFLGR